MIEELEKTIEGHIKGFSLASFMQLIELYRRTCTLTISSNHGASKGKLYFKKGALIAAQTLNLKGEEAACNILTWKDVNIFIESYCKKDVVEITKPNMTIVMKAEKSLEEQSLHGKQPSDCEIPHKIKRLSEYMKQSRFLSGYNIFNADSELILSANPVAFKPESSLLNSFKTLWHLNESKIGPPQFLMLSATSGKRFIYFELEEYGIMTDLGLGKMPDDFINFIHPAIAAI